MYGNNFYYPYNGYGNKPTPYNQPSFNNPYQYQPPAYPTGAAGQQSGTQQLFRVQAVTNIDEARAAIVEPDVIAIFTDFANGKIYTKQLNMADGTSIFRAYETAQPAVAREQAEYAPLSDVETLKADVEALKKIVADSAAKPGTGNRGKRLPDIRAKRL